uniref:DNA repair protein REV1 n=1 Tax=Rhodnius prolixus TaxID=13249 RepID=T1HD53_RHOPR
MKRRKRERENGFEDWGGYMEAKKKKLIQQFNDEAEKSNKKVNDLFKGIAIFVNGYTVPSADELRCLMIKHGGSYHHYFKSDATTHIIASNLPNSKIKMTQNLKIIKPAWITDSIKAEKILNYTDYLLHSNQSTTQPSLKNVIQTYGNKNKKMASVKDATHEHFLSEFYNNSRLHHISTMSTIFKDYINEIRVDKTHQLDGRNELLRNSKGRPDCFPLPSFSNKDDKCIMHIDMDCFFVSVGLRDKPELRNHPVVVTHSNGNLAAARDRTNAQNELTAYRKKLESKGKIITKETSGEHRSFNINELDSMSEIASCSYEARKAGIKNGMFVGQALKLCPNLKFIHYDFESYKEVSFILYNTVARYTVDIEAVSCDEMYVDCTELLKTASLEPMEFAKILRAEIKKKTGCPCSVGFGGNRLQARLATKKAKPDGQFYLNEENIVSFMHSLPVSDLPGVGGSTSYKLRNMGIKTCGDLQNTSLTCLQEEFGKRLGETLHKNCFGNDDKPLQFHHVRKSVSADINYGIRFQNDDERDKFLKKLSEEVSNRLNSVKMKGRSVTLKLMVRSKDAPEETAKYLGHGVCDQISKGTTLPTATSDASLILREVLKIMKNVSINCKELRGIGIQISRLESQLPPDNKLKQFLTGNKKVIKSDQIIMPSTSSMESIPKIRNAYEDLSLSQIDQSFLDAMPVDIQQEIMSNIKQSRSVSNLRCKHQKAINLEKTVGKEPKESNISFKKENKEIADQSNQNAEMKTYISPKELRILVKQWVELEEEPSSRDVSMIIQYLQHLAIAEHLEDLLIIIKSFYRLYHYSFLSSCKVSHK